MKLKLLTIGILALLLCAMVPMAATAAPTKTTVTKPVYFYTIGTFALGPKSGSITFDPVSGAYSLSLNSHLTPYTAYFLSVATITTNNGAQAHTLVTVNTDPHGHLRATGTFTPDQLSAISTYLNSGGYFVVVLFF